MTFFIVLLAVLIILLYALALISAFFSARAYVEHLNPDDWRAWYLMMLTACLGVTVLSFLELTVQLQDRLYP